MYTRKKLFRNFHNFKLYLHNFCHRQRETAVCNNVVSVEQISANVAHYARNYYSRRCFVARTRNAYVLSRAWRRNVCLREKKLIFSDVNISEDCESFSSSSAARYGEGSTNYSFEISGRADDTVTERNVASPLTAASPDEF